MEKSADELKKVGRGKTSVGGGAGSGAGGAEQRRKIQ